MGSRYLNEEPKQLNFTGTLQEWEHRDEPLGRTRCHQRFIESVRQRTSNGRNLSNNGFQTTLPNAIGQLACGMFCTDVRLYRSNKLEISVGHA